MSSQYPAARTDRPSPSAGNRRKTRPATRGHETLEPRCFLSAAGLQAYPLVTYDATTANAAAVVPLALTSPPPAPLPYLNDENQTAPPTPAPGAPPIGQQLYPRLNMTQSSVGNTEVASKYDTVAYDGSRVSQAQQMKFAYPDTTVLRYFLPTSYQVEHATDGKLMPFSSTGPVTDGNGQVFAGHWLYQAGTTTLLPITPTTLTISVHDASRFKAGQYVVIYDGPAGSFINAEHDLIASVNKTAGTITLSARGFKSTPLAHLPGAIVAQHELGVGGNGSTVNPQDWAYNISSDAPRDALGQQFDVFHANWIVQHLNLDAHGNPVGNFQFDGLIFDGEIGNFLVNPLDDTNNDLVADSGIDAAGNNVHGIGLDTFYATVRAQVPASTMLVGGTGLVRGFASLNGVQNEGSPHVNTSYVSPPNYTMFDQKLDHFMYHAHAGAIGPQYNEDLNKTPTLLYPVLQNGGTAPTSNAPFRFSFGFAMLEDGSYGQDRGGIDAWWDEYSVDVVPGSPTFGQAIADNPANEANVRAHEGWLGNPLGPRARLYDPTVFAAGNTLIANGGFENGVAGWTGSNVALNSETTPADVFQGTHSLHVSPQTTFSRSVAGAAAGSPLVALQAGVSYTVSFAAKSSELREMSLSLGKSAVQSVFVGTDWQRHVLTFTPSKSGNYNLSFMLGQENSDVWIDEVYLFKGNADVFQRDFTNGTIFVNATAAAQTIQLGATYQRIQGTQDPLNNGSLVSGSITIAPYDSAILIRQGASSVAPAAPGNLTAIAISSSQANLHWLDLSGNESGFKIERRLTTDASFTVVATVNAGVTSYADSGLSAGKSYVYRVQATNSIGDSTPGNTVPLTAPTVPVPATPINLVAVTTTNQVQLSWVNAANNATAFEIERSIGTPNLFLQIAQVNTNYRLYNDLNLLPGTTYYYRMRSSNSAGFSAYTPVIVTSTHLLTGAAAPLVSAAVQPVDVLLAQGVNLAAGVVGGPTAVRVATGTIPGQAAPIGVQPVARLSLPVESLAAAFDSDPWRLRTRKPG